MISVLYVDDESALLEITKNGMERGGEFTVDTAISAREAIEKLKGSRYDALVADYLMPEMDGISLLKYLRPRCNGMPFILFTGNGGEEVAVEALNAGADFYVQKKGSPRAQVAELQTRIRSAVARRQSERALKQSEETFRSLVDQLDDTVFTVNEEGIFTYVSPGIRRFGHEPKDLTGRDFALLVSAEDIPSVARRLGEVRSGATPSFAFRIAGREGKVHSVRAVFRPRTDHGQFIGAAGQITGISCGETETINPGERDWEELFTYAPAAQLVLSPDGRVTGASRAGTVMLGSSPEEITGKNLADFFAPEEGARLLAWFAGTVGSGTTYKEQFVVRLSGDNPVIVSLAGAAIRGSKRETCRILVTLTDISGQERKDADLKAAISAAEAVVTGARDGILVCTPDRHVSRWNPTLEDITGISAPDAIGKPLEALLPFLGETGRDAVARACTGEIVATPDLRYEFPAVGKQGWLRAIFSPLRTTAGAITGAIGVVQEITARKKVLLKLGTDQRLYAIGAQAETDAGSLRELDRVLYETCRNAVDGDTLCMSWMGLFDQAAGILRPVAQAGTESDLPKEGYPVTREDPAACPACEAILAGSPRIVSDISTDPAAGSWKEEALRNGYRSLAALPFRFKGEVVGALTLCSREPYAFSSGNSDALVHLGSVLSSALDLLDKKTLQRRAGKGGRGSWERTRFLAGGIESAALPFAAVHADGSTGAVNPAFCSFLGYAEEELIRLPLLSVLSFQESEKDRFLQVLATQRPDRYGCTVKRKDGTPVPVEVILQAVPDETGGQPCVGIFLVDVSEKEQKADSLEKERSKYRTIVEETVAAVVVATPDGDILYANPAACSLLGRTGREISLLGGKGLTGDGDPRFVELARLCGESGRAAGEMRLLRGDGTGLDVYAEAKKFPKQNGRPALILVFRDITAEKKTADVRLQEQETPFALLESLPFPVRLTENEDDCAYFNRAWYAFTGRTPEQERGSGWEESVFPGDRDRYRRTPGTASDPGTPVVSEYRLMHHSGEYRRVRETCIPGAVRDRTLCIITDIHEARQAEESCRYLENLYRAVIETAGEAILLIGDRILDGNDAAARLSGCTRAELAGQEPFLYSPRDQPDGRVSVKAVQQYLAAARSGMHQEFLWTFGRDGGPFREGQVTLVPVNGANGQLILAVIADKTDLGRAFRENQRLSIFSELNPYPVIDVGADRVIVYANPATLSVLSDLGLPANAETFLPADFDFIALDLKKEPGKTAERVVQIKERSFYETICIPPGQDTFRIYTYDITERVQATAALEYANHKLGILTSITRHDIQNKLTGVMGYLDLLRGSLRDPLLLGFLDKAEASAEAIRHHIEFTRDYESLGGTAPAWQDLGPILADIRSHLDAGTIAFEDPGKGFSVFADPMFAKVLYNLVDNSLRHGVHVRSIRVNAMPDESGGCTLTYEDDGVGVPQDKKEVIFERGFTTSSGPKKTSGLGLFLVRDILSITGIMIKETGVPGSGTRFEMSIPPGKWRTGPAG